MTDAGRQVFDPSLQAVLFQCSGLLDRLDTFTPSEFPISAIRLRDLFALLAGRVRSRLWALHQGRVREPDGRLRHQLTEGEIRQVNQLGNLVQTLFAWVRYLESSRPPSTPPEIQAAITTLVQRHVAEAIRCEPDEVVALVRPQWDYNLKFVNLLEHLNKLFDISLLDPELEFQAEDLSTFLARLWEDEVSRSAVQPPEKGDAERTRLPRHVVVISFAGLDAHDALLYPLLAHEIAHLIDAAYAATVHGNDRLRRQERGITRHDIEERFNSVYPPEPPSVALENYRWDEISRRLREATENLDRCLGEITADLLAARMLGLPYFFAMAEFLKAIHAWPQDPLDYSTGYPGMAFRLELVYREITDPGAGLCVIDQLRNQLTASTPPAARDAIQRGVDYLSEWEQRFRRLGPPLFPQGTVASELARLIFERVQATLPDLIALVREVIPAERTPRIESGLGDLVTLLQERVPPAQYLLCREALATGPPNSSFADVLTAGWIYELGIGDDRGERSASPEEARREYRNTCQLLFKAIELHGAREAVRSLDPDALTPAPERPHPPSTGGSGAASGILLVDALCRDELSQRLFLMPYYGLRPLNAATLDIRLGNWFRIARRTQSTSIDLTDKGKLQKIRRE